jgi:formylglycine-generating enzyme required for sulfatase activity
VKKHVKGIIFLLFLLTGFTRIWAQEPEIFNYKIIEPNPGNAAAWKQAWEAQLAECGQYTANYARNTLLASYLVYSANLIQSGIDRDAKTRNFSCEVALYPDAKWAAPITEALNAVYAGLLGTGQSAAWKLSWPSDARGETSWQTDIQYSTALQLLNNKGQVLGTQTVPLSAGWRIGFNSGKAEAARNQTIITVTFPGIKDSQITDGMTVKVVSLNRTPAEEASRTNKVTIMTDAAYVEAVLGIEIKKGMVRLPGGNFTMGSPITEAGRNDDETQHQVTVQAFWIGQYEVTQAEYQALMKTNPSNFKGDKLPVESVSWYDAVDYCNARSLAESLTPAYTVNGVNVTWDRTANGYRLPTEAEWEYACRAGAATAWHTGNADNDALKAAAWYSANSTSTTHTTGQKQPNAWRLYDMHGNVWEWCWDIYGAYPRGAQSNPAGAAFESGNRVLRGGSWYHSARILRSACRNSFNPSGGYFIIGFRLARNY